MKCDQLTVWEERREKSRQKNKRVYDVLKEERKKNYFYMFIVRLEIMIESKFDRISWDHYDINAVLFCC